MIQKNEFEQVTQQVQTDQPKDRQTEGPMDRWTDGQIESRDRD